MYDSDRLNPQEKKACDTLYHEDDSLKRRDSGHSELARIIPPRPSHLPLGGPRIIEFLGFRTGKNKWCRKTVSFDFIDTNTSQIITRTVVADTAVSDQSYFTRFVLKLTNDPQKFREATRGGGDALGTLINEQRGKKYTADCEPSKTGMHTNIIDLRPLEAPRFDTTSRKGSTTSFPLG
jgi:hypothetical protein